MVLEPLRRVALLVALALAVAAPLVLSRPASAAAWEAGAFEPTAELELVALTNQSRQAAGLPPLEVDDRLIALARWRSRDMAERAYFAHVLPGGGTVFDELSRREYCFRLAGENIGWNTWSDPEATRGIHGMFLDSPGHRRNVVGADWDAIGVGAYKAPDGRKLWTVLFADACERTPEAALEASGPTAAPAPAVAPAGNGEVAGALGRLGPALLDLLHRLLAIGTEVLSAR